MENERETCTPRRINERDHRRNKLDEALRADDFLRATKTTRILHKNKRSLNTESWELSRWFFHKKKILPGRHQRRRWRLVIHGTTMTLVDKVSRQGGRIRSPRKYTSIFPRKMKKTEPTTSWGKTFIPEYFAISRQEEIETNQNAKHSKGGLRWWQSLIFSHDTLFPWFPFLLTRVKQ
jgi:hypothetical protein